MVKKIIFDLDETLIPWDPKWDSAVNETLDEFGFKYDQKMLDEYQKAIETYELSKKRYSLQELSNYFKDYMGIEFPVEFFSSWIDKMSVLVLPRDERLIALLEKLSKKYSLVVATNWFKRQQVSKLKLCGYYDYIDEVITGEDFDIKPSTDMFNYYKRGFQDDEVIMVGDTYLTDIVGANNANLHAYFITKDPKYSSNKDYTVIKDIYELDKYL